MTRKSRREIEREIRDLATDDPGDIDVTSTVVTVTDSGAEEKEPPEPKGATVPTESDVVTVHKPPRENADVEE